MTVNQSLLRNTLPAVSPPLLGIRPVNLASATPVQLLERKVTAWAETLAPSQGGALTQPVPAMGTSLPASSAVRTQIPTYVTTPSYAGANANANASTSLVNLLAPPGSVMLEAPGLPLPLLSPRFTVEQADAITGALTKKTIEAFGSLDDDRRKVLARTLIRTGLNELQRGLIRPDDFKYVVRFIYKVAKAMPLPVVTVRTLQSVPGATQAPPSSSSLARTYIEKSKVNAGLSVEQKDALATIVVKNWELERRTNKTALSIEPFLRNATPVQWRDWVDSARDVGFQILPETWESSLLRITGDRSTIVADIKRAFPDDPQKRLALAKLISTGSSLQQGIAALNGRAFSIEQVRQKGDHLFILFDKVPKRNEQTRGPEKLTDGFPIQLANYLDQVAPKQWFAIRNSAGNWSIRTREKVGAAFAPFATVKVPKSESKNHVWTISITPDKTPSEKTKELILSRDIVKQLDLQFGVGKWSARQEAPSRIAIEVAGKRIGYVSILESEPQRYVKARPTGERHVDKNLVGTESIKKLNALAGSTHWYLREGPNRSLTAVMPKSSRMIARLIPEGDAKPQTYKVVAVTRGTIQNDSSMRLPVEISALCDEAFGEGRYRATFIKAGYFQVRLKSEFNSGIQSAHIGTVSLENDPRTGIEKWVLRRSK